MVCRHRQGIFWSIGAKKETAPKLAQTWELRCKGCCKILILRLVISLGLPAISSFVKSFRISSFGILSQNPDGGDSDANIGISF
jgi:hypothetical protein